MIHDDLHSIRFGYLRRVLSTRWPLPSRTPQILAVSRDSSAVAAKFERLGFRIEGIRIQDFSLERLSRRLAGRTAAFDIVCCWDVLEHVNDWQAIVGLMGRSLRCRGVFFYSVSGQAKGGWSLVNRLSRQWLDPSDLISPRDLHATLRREGLFPQRVVGLGQEGHSVRYGVVFYMGYAFRGRDRPVSLTDGPTTPGNIKQRSA